MIRQEEQRLHLLFIGAGSVAFLSARQVLLRMRECNPNARITVTIYDQSCLDESYLARPGSSSPGSRGPVAAGIYEGRAGQGKAPALAEFIERDRGLRGIAVDVRHGNITRWPIDEFEADLAIVALDNEPSRLAVQRLLRLAQTPAIFVGINDAVAVHVISGRAEEACYCCQGQESVPLLATPCHPRARLISTREFIREESCKILQRELPELTVEAAAGKGFGSFWSFTGDDRVGASLSRDLHCVGAHPQMGNVIGDLRIGVEQSLGALLEAAAGFLPVDPERGARIEHASIRLDYSCRSCGRGPMQGGDLARAWPEQERCPSCDSRQVTPLLRLQEIDLTEARHLGLTGRSLAELGFPPGLVLLCSGKTTLRCRLLPKPVSGRVWQRTELARP